MALGTLLLCEIEKCSVPMNILISTLKEELNTVSRLERRYLRELKKIPVGSFVLRKKGAKAYGYLTRREGGKVIQDYLGALDEKAIQNYRHQMDLKREYKEKLKTVRSQLKIILRALRGKTK